MFYMASQLARVYVRASSFACCAGKLHELLQRTRSSASARPGDWSGPSESDGDESVSSDRERSKLTSPPSRKRNLAEVDSPSGRTAPAILKRPSAGNTPEPTRNAGTGLSRAGSTCFIVATVAVILRVPHFREMLHAAEAAGATRGIQPRPLLHALLQAASGMDAHPNSVISIAAVVEVSCLSRCVLLPVCSCLLMFVCAPVTGGAEVAAT